MIALGSDHGGWALKQEVMKHLDARGLEYKDYGTYSEDSCDYPVYGKAVAHAVADGECEKGHHNLRHRHRHFHHGKQGQRGIRAALCGDCFSAEMTRLHNDANILAMGARVVGPGLALKIVDTFLDTPFSGDERHVRRIKQIED